MARKFDDFFWYAVLVTIINVGWRAALNLVMTPTEPPFNTEAIIKTFIMILVAFVLFGFQNVAMLSERMILALMVAIPTALYFVLIRSQFSGILVQALANGEADATGIFGWVGKSLYDFLLSKHVDTAKSMVTIVQVLIEAVNFLIIELWVLAFGHIFGVLPNVTPAEKSYFNIGLIKDRFVRRY